jgi:microcystin-dependent protein
MNIGTIKMAGRNGLLVTFGGETWLLCNGQLVLVATYPDLFTLIAYTYGGAGLNFAVPNYGVNGAILGAIPVGTSGGGGYALAGTAGANSHDHSVPAGTPAWTHGPPATLSTGGANTTVAVVGAGANLVASGGHFHISNPINPHLVAGQMIGSSTDKSPCTPVGFYIRAL